MNRVQSLSPRGAAADLHTSIAMRIFSVRLDSRYGKFA
jgi:hypothetical protein